ncbi:hypothetical protein WMF30_12240 [Sorangium sp. So ce134]
MPATSLLGSESEFFEHGVVNVNGDARLALRGEERTAPGFHKRSPGDLLRGE